MPRMKHKDVLAAIRAAGYHGDKERGFLLYVKNWVSLSAYGREFEAGAAMRQKGVSCNCKDCQKDQRIASQGSEDSRSGESSDSPHPFGPARLISQVHCE